MKSGTIVSWGFLGETSIYTGIPAVQWTATATQLTESIFSVRLIATLTPGLRLFSQYMPEAARKHPTHIGFEEDPRLEMLGEIREVGNGFSIHEDTLMIMPNRYQKISYLQVVQFLDRKKSNISGLIRFQACSEDILMEPALKAFNIQVIR